MSAPKKYGLILPKSKQGSSSSKPSMGANVFGDDSDDEHSKSNIEAMIKKESTRNLSKVNTQLMMQKALDEDANVFEYDEVYDDMKTKKEEQDLANKVVTKDKKPRYIENLIKNAAARKKEDEKRQQRKIQKEREDEKEEYGDKESFVTSAYKKKLEEMAREEEEAKRKEQLEEMMDVTKQKDLSGFYRHLLKQQCGEEKVPDSSRTTIKQEDVETKASEEKPSGSKLSSKQKRKKTDPDSDSEEGSSDDEETVKLQKTAARTYRKRKQQSDSEDEQKPAEPNPDADESLEESSSESEAEENEPKEKDVTKKDEAKTLTTEPPAPKKKKPDWKEMFTKRCVGDRFQEARERFLERKAARVGLSVQ